MAKGKQVAALPWRRGRGGLEVLLVTTRTTKRWVLPKGWPIDGKSDAQSAAQEAFEEAGVAGAVDGEPFGRFGYLKFKESGKAQRLRVTVFCLEVQAEFEQWPEQHERQRKWASPTEAMQLVGEAELVPLLLQFSQRLPAVSTEEEPSRATAKPLFQRLLALLNPFHLGRRR